MEKLEKTRKAAGKEPERPTGSSASDLADFPQEAEAVELHLVAQAPPGRADRKAKTFQSEIARMRAEGHTLDAIRRSLAAAGVHVGITTVWRECHRRRGRVATQPRNMAFDAIDGREPIARAPPIAKPKPPNRPQLPSNASERRSGKDIAEEFRRRQCTNLLVRAKEKS